MIVNLVFHSSSTALFTFSDGRYIGAILDRNGLRPSRYYVTKQGFMVMASEVGVSTFPDQEIVQKVGKNLTNEPVYKAECISRVFNPVSLTAPVLSLQFWKNDTNMAMEGLLKVTTSLMSHCNAVFFFFFFSDHHLKIEFK